MTRASMPTVCLVVESGTDARLVEGLAARVPLHVIAREIPNGRVISQRTDVSVAIAPARRGAFAWRVWRTLIARSSCDVVLVQGYGLAALAANLAARLRRLPCWMLVCSPAAEYYQARRQAGQPFSRLTLAAIHAMARLNGIVGRGYIVLSQHLRDVVRRDAPGKPVHVIPVYGVDFTRFADRPDRAAVRHARGLPTGARIILTSSRVAPEKDTATLIEAFAALVREGRDVYLLHRSGGYREFLDAASRAGVARRVIATDAVDPRHELALDYLAADVCVQASRAEGLGFSVLESLACGTPVVATAIGGLAETVLDGATGWAVPPSDPGALAAALRDALDRPEEAQRRAAAGAALVRERFDSEAVFARLARLLEASSAR
jgi:glycosyltransferase involved in cell wall biosynthesis